MYTGRLKKQQDVYTPTSPAFLIHSREELKPYDKQKYRKIYMEMKYAYKFPRNSFPFMKLPPELRNEVYRHALVASRPFELWAETGSFSHNRWLHDHAIRNYWIQTKSNRGKYNIRLLRVSKMVHEEAGSIYYGENKFRFSGLNGWMVARAFLHTIGERHYRWLTSITVPVPFWSPDVTMYGENWCVDSQTSCWKLKSTIYPLGHPRGLEFFYEHTCVRTCEILAGVDGGHLRQVSLVLPENFEFAHRGNQEALWEALRLLQLSRDGIYVSITRLCKFSGWSWYAIPSEHVELLRRARGYGWNIKRATFKRDGNYQIEPDDVVVPGETWDDQAFMDLLGLSRRLDEDDDIW